MSNHALSENNSIIYAASSKALRALVRKPHYSQRTEDPRRLRDLVVHRTDALHLLAEPCAVGVERTELRTKGGVCLGLRRHGPAG